MKPKVIKSTSTPTTRSDAKWWVLEDSGMFPLDVEEYDYLADLPHLGDIGEDDPFSSADLSSGSVAFTEKTVVDETTIGKAVLNERDDKANAEDQGKQRLQNHKVEPEWVHQEAYILDLQRSVFENNEEPVTSALESGKIARSAEAEKTGLSAIKNFRPLETNATLDANPRDAQEAQEPDDDDPFEILEGAIMEGISANTPVEEAAKTRREEGDKEHVEEDAFDGM
jgi:hypothetical protein